MDFLGLRNLDVIEIALDLIEQTTGSRPDIDNVPLDDEKTFELLRRADTIGVFQLEGGPLRSLLRSPRADLVRRRRGRHRAVPARPDGPELAHRIRGAQERSPPGQLRPPRSRRDPRPDVRADDLPRAAHARVAEARGLLAGRGRQPPQGHRQEDPRAHRQGALEVRRRVRAATATPRNSRRRTSPRSSPSPTTRSTSRTASATDSSRTRPRG